MTFNLGTLMGDYTDGRISRREFIKRVAALTGSLSFAALALSACGGDDADDDDEPAPSGGDSTATTSTSPGGAATTPTTTGSSATEAPATGAAQAGGTLTHGSAQEPDRFWTPITGLTVSSEVARLVNATLIETDETINFIPELAVDVPSLENGGISEDGLTYTFTLREGINWHDGTPFTSADVKFTYEVIVMEGVDVRSRVGWDQVAEVATPDDVTVVFTFSEVDAPFLDRIASLEMLPQHILGGLSAEEINIHEWFQAPVGVGPFVFKEWVRGSHIIVEKNPDYYKPDRPALDSVIYKIIPDANTLVNQIETGDVDTRVRLSNSDVGIVEQFEDVEVVTVATVTPWLLMLNNTRPVFSDKRVRQALEYGFDKVGLCEQLLQGRVEPAWGVMSPLSWAYNPNIPMHAYDPEKAGQLLDEAGWVMGSDDVREKDGEKLTFELMNIAGEQERVQILSFIQAQWKEIGVDAQIKLVDVGTMFGNALPNRDFDMTYSYIGRSADPDISAMYLSPEHSSANYAGYSNPDVDELLFASRRTVDRDERKDLLGQALEIVGDETVYIFIAWLASHTAINKRVQGYLPTPASIEFWNADAWSISE